MAPIIASTINDSEISNEWFLRWIKSLGLKFAKPGLKNLQTIYHVESSLQIREIFSRKYYALLFSFNSQDYLLYKMFV